MQKTTHMAHDSFFKTTHMAHEILTKKRKIRIRKIVKNYTD